MIASHVPDIALDGIKENLCRLIKVDVEVPIAEVYKSFKTGYYSITQLINRHG